MGAGIPRVPGAVHDVPRQGRWVQSVLRPVQVPQEEREALCRKLRASLERARLVFKEGKAERGSNGTGPYLGKGAKLRDAGWESLGGPGGGDWTPDFDSDERP